MTVINPPTKLKQHTMGYKVKICIQLAVQFINQIKKTEEEEMRDEINNKRNSAKDHTLQEFLDFLQTKIND